MDPSNIQLFKRSDGTIYPKLSNYALKKVTLSDDGKNFVAPEVYKGGEKVCPIAFLILLNLLITLSIVHLDIEL